MIKSWMGPAVMACAAIGANTAQACQCRNPDEAGFIHAKVERLPSNARGALFVTPWHSLRHLAQVDGTSAIYDGNPEKLGPSSFTISTDAAPGTLPVALSWPDTSRGVAKAAPRRAFRYANQADEAGARAVKPADIAPLLRAGTLVEISDAVNDERRLVRVGPVDGFRAGARYTIRYVGKAALGKFPGVVEHVIDAAPLNAAGARYSLALDGAPLARMLEAPTSMSCSGEQAALVQDFHYVIPASHLPYRDAILFFSESRPVKRAQLPFARVLYLPSSCTTTPYGRTAFDAGRDMIHAFCETATSPVTVRGWAGMLEVEDRLHPVDAVRIDLSMARRGACARLSRRVER